ncbi:hypothetical protein LINPERPRIM_LOCUS38716 [Linum perenne]
MDTGSSDPDAQSQILSRVSVRAKTDSAWGYAQQNGTKITCLLCSHTFAGGGISRFKNHLAGVPGNVRACPKAPPDVRAAMLTNLAETSKKNKTLAAQKRYFSEMARGDSSSEPNYSEDTPESNEDTTPIRTPNPCPRSGGSLLQPNIKSALRGKDAALRTDRAITRFWYEHCLPFNVVASPSFPVLINMIASMEFAKTGKNLFELFDSVIQWVGVQNVVQVVTDNVVNYVAAGKMINARYKHIYRTPCVAHTVNLVFKDICALPHIDRLVKSASKITTFLYNHGALLHWLRERPSWKEI